MVFLSILVGFIAGVTVLGNLVAITAKLLQQQVETLTTSMLLGYVAFNAVCAMAAGVACGLTTLGLLARVCRGNRAVGFSRPSDCTSLATWAYTRWHYYGRGYQIGLRIFGVEIALKGEVA